MKKFLFILLMVYPFIFFAQNHTFILIDISGNPKDADDSDKISNEERVKAIDIVEKILCQNLETSVFPEWTINASDAILESAIKMTANHYLKTNDILAIIPYGERNTYLSFKIFNGSSVDANIKNAIEFARTLNFKDQLTFGELARAKAADIAIDAGISSYYLIEIAGLGGDQTGSKGMSNQEQELVDQYNSRVILESMGLLSSKHSILRISLKKINLKNINPNPKQGSKGIIKPLNVTNHNFRLLSPNGTKGNPTKYKKEQQVIVSWTIMGAPEGTKYIVEAIGQGNKNKSTKQCVDCNSLSLILKTGTYRITIRGIGLPVCENNGVYVKIKGNSSKGFLTFIIILAIIIGILYILRKNNVFNRERQKDKKKTEKESEHDEFDINI